LLNLAGFKKVLQIDKERTVFKHQEAKICIDKVKDYKDGFRRDWELVSNFSSRIFIKIV
jgi:hypothetical protein